MFKLLMQSKFKFFKLIFLGVLLSVMGVASALIYGELINSVSRGVEINILVRNILLTLGFTIALGLLNWYYGYYYDMFMHKGVAKTRNAYMKKVLHSKYSVVKEDDSSKTLNHVTGDISSVNRRYMGNAVWLINNLVGTLGAFVAAAVLNWKIALTMLGFTGIMALLPIFIKKKYDRASYLASDSNKTYISSLKENLLGISIIKTFSAEDVCLNNLFSTNANVVKAHKRLAYIDSIASGLGFMIKDVSIVSLIGLTCYFVFTGEVEIGAVLSIFSIGARFYNGILGAAGSVTAIQGMKTINKNIKTVLDRDVSEAPVTPAQFNERITLENVTFKYSDKERDILSDVSLTFEKDKKYLILGRSGSGKSTLLKLLAKFYDNYTGIIALDGKNYLDLTEKEVATFLALSQQDCYLFNRPVKSNIDFLQDNDGQKLEEIIEKTALTDFINLMPEGADTVINEEINQVSGGEKLRINLARALYRHSDMILLDEVTSSLDKKTAEYVENNLLNLQNKTIINVCHKFNDKTLPLYDKIIIMENGRVVREGHYNELMDDAKLKSYRNLN